ncbi:phage tail tape measure protein [Allorhodopirellula solitaria]|uniref:Phage-related minor tail protein n=1 Tax=Allorhodopirellula solitaria TaxID=2527987 RepID=A0A5C5X117_9BACT|nr:phage tail tape measure protein [Allorhodopirellula solitaria]TWT56500.1 Phage-related minor tail protein [Allorhodopirellula solitaria]
MGRSSIKAGKAEVEIGLRNRIAQGAKGVERDLNRLGKRATSIGRMIGGVGLAIGTPFAYAAVKFAAFDDAMRAVGAVSQASAIDLAMLTDTAKELGRTTSYTAVDVASLMGELGRAGFKPDQINEMTGAVLNLAKATGTDATLAAGIMSATIRQYGLAATDAARVSDVLTAAANGSFNTVEALGEAMKYAGPVAADLGMSLEETAAILGTLGNVGIQGSMAGTTLKRLSVISAAELGNLEKIFGRSFRDAAGSGLPLIDMLEQISVATNGLDQNSRVEKMNAAFGLLGITGASAIGKSTTATRELLETLENAAGVAAETADKMDGGLGGSFRKIQSAIEGATIAVGESFSPALQSMVDQLTSSIGAVTQWIDENQGLVLALAGTSIGLIGTGAALVGVGISAQIAAAGIGLLLSPIVLATAGVAAMGYAFVKYTSIGADAVDWLSTRFSPLVETAQNAVSAIGDAIKAGDLETAWELTTQLMELVWLDLTGGLQDAWAEAMGYVLDAGSTTTEQMGKLFQSLAGTLKTLFDSYKDIYDSIYNSAESEFSKSVDSYMGVETIGAPVEPTGSAFEQQFGTANDSLNSTIAGIREFGSALEAESAGMIGERMAERQASRKERQARIDALRNQLQTATSDANARAKQPKKSEPEKPSADEKPDFAAMLKANGYEQPTTIDTPKSNSGATGTSSGFAALAMRGGPSMPQKMLTLTERIAKAVERRDFLRQGKADRELARDQKLQVKAEENKKKFGTEEVSPNDALEALWAESEPGNAVDTPMDDIRKQTVARQSVAIDTRDAIANASTYKGRNADPTKPAVTSGAATESIESKQLICLKHLVSNSDKQVRKDNMARWG